MFHHLLSQPVRTQLNPLSLARRKRVVQNPVFVENINLQLIGHLVFFFSLNIFGKEKHKKIETVWTEFMIVI